MSEPWVCTGCGMTYPDNCVCPNLAMAHVGTVTHSPDFKSEPCPACDVVGGICYQCRFIAEHNMTVELRELRAQLAEAQEQFRMLQDDMDICIDPYGIGDASKAAMERNSMWQELQATRTERDAALKRAAEAEARLKWHEDEAWKVERFKLELFEDAKSARAYAARWKALAKRQFKDLATCDRTLEKLYVERSAIVTERNALREALQDAKLWLEGWRSGIRTVPAIGPSEREKLIAAIDTALAKGGG